MTGTTRSRDVDLRVVGIGNALLDVIVPVPDGLPAELGLDRGAMDLVAEERAGMILSEAERSATGSVLRRSGGSAANTMAGVASLGVYAGFAGRVADDAKGEIFAKDLAAAGVTFIPCGQGGLDGGSGHCTVLVTPDAERTMATHLGIAARLEIDDDALTVLAGYQLLYVEAYLWDLPGTKDAIRLAMANAHESGGVVAMSLSDSFCVSRHRDELAALVQGSVDVLFANESEIVDLTSAPSIEEAAEIVSDWVGLAALTRGALGSMLVCDDGILDVPATVIGSVVDTTGAGDLYAAGVLAGLAYGMGHYECATLGALAAGEVIGHLGARPERSLAQLAQERGILLGAGGGFPEAKPRAPGRSGSAEAPPAGTVRP